MSVLFVTRVVRSSKIGRVNSSAMPRVHLFCCLLFLAGPLFSQVLTVSDEILLRSDTEYHLVGKAGGKVMLLQDRKTKHLVTAYDRRMQESWEKTLTLRGRNIRLVEALEHSRGFQLLYLFREAGQNYLQLDTYDPAANIRDSVTLTNFNAWLNNPTYDIVRSQDQSKLLVILGENQQKVTCLSVDLDSSRLLYQVEVAPDKFFFNADFIQAEISNQGDAFLFIQRDNFHSQRKVHRYEVQYLSASARTLKQFDIPLGDSLTYDVFFKYDNLNQRIVASGLYTKRELSRADGFFYLAADPISEQLLTSQFTPFPTKLAENLDGKKAKQSLEEISVRDAILRRDGGILLITERNRQLERRGAANRVQIMNTYTGRPLVDYYYDEIVVFNINPDGKPNWDNILHKKQYSQDDGGAFSSFMLLESASALRFLFNDEIRFENTVSEYALDSEGSVRRNSLFSTKDLNLKLRFRDAVQVAANEVIIPSELRSRMRLVTMTY